MKMEFYVFVFAFFSILLIKKTNGNFQKLTEGI